MKAEDSTASPAPATTATPVAKPWPQDSIAYQHYQPYSSHYPQAAYGHYQYATMQAQLLRPATTTPVTAAAAATPAPTAAAPAAAVDNADISTLNDALGSAGVDLKAEEESLQRGHDQHQPYRPYEDRTRKQAPKPSFDTTHLGTKMRSIASSHKVSRIPDDTINYLALALRARLQDLITHMIDASHHRTSTQFDRPASLYADRTPMWSIVVRSDVAKQLAALEKVEREEEIKVRRERKERAEMTAAHAAALAAQANGAAAAAAAASASGAADGGAGAASSAGAGAGAGDGEEGGAKKKRKKDGPGVTARNMSEDVRKKMSNAVATQAAGLGGKYAWMTAASAASSPAVPKPKQQPPPPAPLPPPATASMTTTANLAATTTAMAATMATSVVGATPSTAAAAAAAATSGTPATATAAAANPATTAASSWAKPYVPTKKSTSTTAAQPTAEDDTRTVVSMRDAIFVIEKERGHGGGRGAARGFI